MSEGTGNTTTRQVRAGDGHTYEYDVLTLPAFPNIPLDVAIDDDGRVWFPVRHICEDALHIDVATQQEKVQQPGGDYDSLWRRVPFPTVKGQRELVALEWEGLGLFFSSIQESRVKLEAKDFIRIFRKQGMRELNKILLRHPRGVAGSDERPALPAPGAQVADPTGGKGAKAVRKRMAQQLQDERLEYLEDAVAEHTHSLAILLNGQGTPATRVARCPCCGAAIRLEVESVRFVPADENE